MKSLPSFDPLSEAAILVDADALLRDPHLAGHVSYKANRRERYGRVVPEYIVARRGMGTVATCYSAKSLVAFLRKQLPRAVSVPA